MNTDKTVGIYRRVSTAEQTAESQSIAVSEYCLAHDIKPSQVEIFSDSVSGVEVSRPALDKMILAIQEGRIKKVLVWRLDRLGRSLKHLMWLMEFFRKHDCAFVSLKENIDTTSASGTLMFYLIGAFAEFERSLISERCKLNVMKRRALNKPVGGKAGRRDRRPRKKDGYFARYRRIREQTKLELNALVGSNVDANALRQSVKAKQKAEKVCSNESAFSSLQAEGSNV